MTLTSRITLIFVAALACVLISFSLAVYAISSYIISYQLSEHLQSSLDTMTAAMEFNEGGATWDPAERRVNLASSFWNDAPVWTISDQNDNLIDGSSSIESLNLLEMSKEHSVGRSVNRSVDQPSKHQLDHSNKQDQEIWRTPAWLIGRRTYRAAPPDEDSPTAIRASHSIEPPQRLSILVGMTNSGGYQVLQRLAGVLALVSLVLFFTGMLLSQSVCNRAIAPVRNMARAAAELQLAEGGMRLPATNSRDELSELNRAFNDLLNRLHEAWIAQKHFTADASHQLRTPLAAILGQIEVARRKPREPQEYQAVMETIHVEAIYLQRIVESLLLLAHSNSGPGECEYIDLAPWLSNHLRSWSNHPRFDDIRIEAGDGTSFEVQTSPVLLAQVVDILIDNASKYSPAGSLIEVVASVKGDRVQLRVADLGYGIDSCELPLLFTPFHRAEEARRRGIRGAGLGLSIAQRIAAVLRGDLRLESTSDHGSKFLLVLPRLID